MKTISIIIFIALSQIGYAQNRLSIESGLDVSFFTKSGLFRNTDRIKTGIFIKSTYTIYERNNFSAGLGLSFKKGASLDEFYDPSSEPYSVRIVPIYNKDGLFRRKDQYFNIQLPVYTSLSLRLNSSTFLLVSLSNQFNLISNRRRSYFEKGVRNAHSSQRVKISFESYFNPEINFSLIFKKIYKIGVFVQNNNLPEYHKSLGMIFGLNI